MSEKKESTALVVAKTVTELLSRQAGGYVERRFRGYIPPEYEAEFIDLIKKLERNGSKMLGDALRTLQFPIEEVTTDIRSNKLFATVRLGGVIDSGGTRLFFCAKAKVFKKKGEEKLIEVVTRRMVRESLASEFKDYFDSLADFALSQAHIFGQLPRLTIGTTAPHRNYFRHLLLLVVHQELSRGSEPGRILKALDRADDELKNDYLFHRWRKEKRISCWWDIRNDRVLWSRWQTFVSKYKKKTGL